jgi:hypothetical protein
MGRLMKTEPTYENGPFRELSTVESQRNEILPEEFPEGPFGAAHDEARLGKATGWEEGQHSTSAFTYENRMFHQGLPRGEPSAHPPHDEPGQEEEGP